ncbi:hypothetical protein FACS189473_4420 [Spirochaetia bacterium]|nr:hypothetical protein FACS189473_4420 [Spirochaetia bacterium]
MFFSACAAAPKAALIQDNPDIQDLWSGVSQAGPYQIIKHKATEQEVPEQGVPEQEIPEWVSRYLDEGIPGVEALPQYEDFYIFVGKNSGTNSDALTQWVTAFTAVQDSPPLITARVQTRFAGASTGMADREYGRYFENLVRTAADTIYTGTRKEADYWILKRFTSGTDDIYDFFVLVSIEKEALKIQLDAIFEGISENFKAPKDQMAAINHLKEIFYDGF